MFPGHCWSNESTNPPLPVRQASPPSSTSFPYWRNISAKVHEPPNGQPSTELVYRLHPSHAPKCTHAYILSRTGARRLWMHLRYEPFAYSRALDQAIAWLVASGAFPPSACSSPRDCVNCRSSDGILGRSQPCRSN
jgi:hypothetical protein